MKEKLKRAKAKVVGFYEDHHEAIWMGCGVIAGLIISVPQVCKGAYNDGYKEGHSDGYKIGCYDGGNNIFDSLYLDADIAGGEYSQTIRDTRSGKRMNVTTKALEPCE